MCLCFWKRHKDAKELVFLSMEVKETEVHVSGVEVGSRVPCEHCEHWVDQEHGGSWASVVLRPASSRRLGTLASLENQHFHRMFKDVCAQYSLRRTGTENFLAGGD